MCQYNQYQRTLTQPNAIGPPPPMPSKVPNLNKAEGLLQIYWKSYGLLFQMNVLNKLSMLNVVKIFQISSFQVLQK
jgi:hypothetical protein